MERGEMTWAHGRGDRQGILKWRGAEEKEEVCVWGCVCVCVCVEGGGGGGGGWVSRRVNYISVLCQCGSLLRDLSPCCRLTGHTRTHTHTHTRACTDARIHTHTHTHTHARTHTHTLIYTRTLINTDKYTLINAHSYHDTQTEMFSVSSFLSSCHYFSLSVTHTHTHTHTHTNTHTHTAVCPRRACIVLFRVIHEVEGPTCNSC